MTEDWRIDESAADWECDWEGSRRFQLRYFRSLPMADKIRAVEEMCRIARALQANNKSAGRDNSK